MQSLVSMRLSIWPAKALWAGGLPRRRKEIRDSRVNGTKNLAQALAQAKDKPRVFICSSAIGYYGDRGDEVLNEESAPGIGFLSEVCVEWEGAASAARGAGIRTV